MCWAMCSGLVSRMTWVCSLQGHTVKETATRTEMTVACWTLLRTYGARRIWNKVLNLVQEVMKGFLRRWVETWRPREISLDMRGDQGSVVEGNAAGLSGFEKGSLGCCEETTSTGVWEEAGEENQALVKPWEGIWSLPRAGSIIQTFKSE